MKKFFLSLIISLSLTSLVFSQDVSDIIKKSDEMFTSIKSLNDFDPLIKFLKDAEWNNKNNFEITWRVGRAISEKAAINYLNYVVDNLAAREIEDVDDILKSDQKFEKWQEKNLLDWGTEARFYMDKAQKLNNDRVETFYYTALSISMYGIGKSIVSALLEGLSGKLTSAFETSIKINKGYLDGAAIRSFGRFHYVLPWPKRDLDESQKLLKQAIQVGPNNILNHLYLGDTEWKLGNKNEAKNAWMNASKTSASTQMEKIYFDKMKNAISKRLSLN